MDTRQFKIVVQLDNFFQDHRREARIFVNKSMKTIEDLENHISQVFGVSSFYLCCQSQFLPPVEDVRVLQEDDVVRVWAKKPCLESHGLPALEKKIFNGRITEITLSQGYTPKASMEAAENEKTNAEATINLQITKLCDTATQSNAVSKPTNHVEIESILEDKKKPTTIVTEASKNDTYTSNNTNLNNSTVPSVEKAINKTASPKTGGIKTNPCHVETDSESEEDSSDDEESIPDAKNKSTTVITETSKNDGCNISNSTHLNKTTVPQQSSTSETASESEDAPTSVKQNRTEKVTCNDTKSFRLMNSVGALVERFQDSSMNGIKRKRKRTRKRKSKLQPTDESLLSVSGCSTTDTNKSSAKHLRFDKMDVESEEACMIQKENRFALYDHNVLKEDDFLKYPLMQDKSPHVGDIVAFKVIKISENYTPEISNYIVAKIQDYNAEKQQVTLHLLAGKEELSAPQGKFFLETEGEDLDIQEMHWKELLTPRLLFP